MKTQRATFTCTSTPPAASVSAGLAIYDTVQYVRPDVRTLCVGLAASAAAVLLAAGAPGKRYALPNARIMIHQPWGQIGQGQAVDLGIQAKEFLRTKRLMEEILARHTGQPHRQGAPGHGPRLLHGPGGGPDLRDDRRHLHSSLEDRRHAAVAERPRAVIGDEDSERSRG